MADTNTTTRTLGVLVQGGNPTDITKLKTVTLTLPNPKTTLQESDFTNDIQLFFVDAARFSGKLDNSDSEQSYGFTVTGAYIQNKSITDLDLTGA